METHTKHVTLYEGSNIILNALKYELEQENISCIIKNNTESGRLAGFVSGANSNVLFIFEEDLSTAENILEKFLNKKV